MMRHWHTPMGLFACVALVAPTVFILWSFREMPVQDGVIPILSSEARAQLLTYHQRCSRQADCEQPLGCFFDGRHGKYCTDSACMTDLQCLEGQRCSTLSTTNGKAEVRLCAPIGPRQEGEHCLKLPLNREASCTADLQCAGTWGYGYCARPCTPGVPGTCAKGFFCADVKPEPSCLPTCEARGCPQGQTCVPFEEGTSICAEVYGTNCVETPCSDGRKCDARPDSRFPGKVWMECVVRCSPANPTCAEGQVCDRYHCVQACDPNGPNPCTEGYHCDRLRKDWPWSCQPDSWPDR
ncbi:hypothetical protein [Corallococcus sp. CA053C]|uniref:hypothetical protein n=1 Tax=Corallococcus sp. CA053C TaxID=2316732 RepID=UPI001F31DF39|nr:hypothetical protein [Corallococcus sp. CA053C]